MSPVFRYFFFSCDCWHKDTAMGRKTKPGQRPMAGFSKIIFASDSEDDGVVAKAVACAQCGATACFCRAGLVLPPQRPYAPPQRPLEPHLGSIDGAQKKRRREHIGKQEITERSTLPTANTLPKDCSSLTTHGASEIAADDARAPREPSRMSKKGRSGETKDEKRARKARKVAKRAEKASASGEAATAART